MERKGGRMVIFEGDVIIDGKEYVLYSTQDDYTYCDLETAIKCCTKEDWDKLMKKENADCYYYKTNIFFHTYDEIMEYWEDRNE